MGSGFRAAPMNANSDCLDGRQGFPGKPPVIRCTYEANAGIHHTRKYLVPSVDWPVGLKDDCRQGSLIGYSLVLVFVEYRAFAVLSTLDMHRQHEQSIERDVLASKPLAWSGSISKTRSSTESGSNSRAWIREREVTRFPSGSPLQVRLQCKTSR